MRGGYGVIVREVTAGGTSRATEVVVASEKLRMSTKVAFGVGSAAESAITIAFNTFNFLFYNNVLGLSGTLCGLAVTISLIGDALFDPIVGSLSDRTRSRLGRRHPWLYAAPIPLALSYYLLYQPPAGLSGFTLFLWFTVFALLQRIAMTFYNVPHLALGAELSRDYRERSVVMSYNVVFHVVGGSLAFFFGWTYLGTIEGGSTVRDGYAPLASMIGLFAAVVIFVSAYFTRDQIPRLPQAASDQPPFSIKQLMGEMGACMKNRNYLMLLFGLLLGSATLGTRETLNSYTSLFFWELPEKGIRVFGLASPPAFVIAFLLTVWLHGKFDKRATLVGAVTVNAFAVAAPIPMKLLGLLPPVGSPQLVGVLFFFVFLFYGALAVTMITILSALADVADEHELATGKRQEGVFFAARTFFAKASSGLGHIVAGIAVDAIGFPTGARPGEVAPDVVFKLALIDGPIACIPALLSIYFYAQYRIDKQRHAEIQRELELRRATSGQRESLPPLPSTDVLAEPAE
jgi:glycoside/pentoside/hexuronide:cation symporter, GPH family